MEREMTWNQVRACDREITLIRGGDDLEPGKSLVLRNQLRWREWMTWRQARVWWSGINSHQRRGWPGARQKLGVSDSIPMERVDDLETGKSLVIRNQLLTEDWMTWSQARVWWSGINSHYCEKMTNGIVREATWDEKTKEICINGRVYCNS